MAAVSATQVSLANMADRFGGKIPVRVYFLDNSSKTFLLESTLTVSELVGMILTKFDVNNFQAFIPYFGLFESLDGVSISTHKNMEEVVSNIIEKWELAGHTNAKFVFMIRMFVPSIYGLEYEFEISQRLEKKLTLREYLLHAEVTDSSLLYFQYMQAVYGVITGQYPVSEEIALKLAALHFCHKFGEFNSSSHKAGFLGGRIVEFIPLKLLKQKSLEGWEAALLDVVEERTINKENDKSPLHLYMLEILPMIPYGCTLFKAKVNAASSTNPFGRQLPTDCVLGIHHLGIHIFEKGSSRKLIRSFRIEDISRWGFKPQEYFCFEVSASSELSGILEFSTVEGKIIADLLTDYSAAYLKEKEREENALVAKPAVVASKPTPAPEKRRKSASKPTESKAQSEAVAETTTPTPKKAAKKATTSVERTEAREPQPAQQPPPVPKSRPVSTTPSHPPPPPPPPITAKEPAKPPLRPTSVDAAAMKIQSRFRGYSLRKEFGIEEAAIIIQSNYRGYRARVMVSNMIEEMLANEDY